MNHWSDRVTPVFQGFVGVVLSFSGLILLIGGERQTEAFERYGYPQWFRIVTGTTEVLGGVGLIVGFFRPLFAVVSGGLVAVTMLGAIYTHLVRGRDHLSTAVPATVLLVLTAIVTARRWAEVNDLDGHGDGGDG